MLLTLALFAVVIVVAFSLGDRATDMESAAETDSTGTSSQATQLLESTDTVRSLYSDWPSINVDGTPMIVGTMMDVEGKTYGDAGGLSDYSRASDSFSHDAFSSPSSMGGSDW